MSTPRFLAGVVTALLITAAGVEPAGAQLPSNDKPWLGSFAVFANRRFHFRLTTQGEILLTPLGEDREPVRESLAIPIAITVEEIRPGKKPLVKPIRAETLVSDQHATRTLEKTVIRGKVTGDASFEVRIEQNHGVISLGGRLLDAGTLRKNPLRFSLRVKFPSAYPYDRKNGKKEAKTFQKKIDDDRIDLTWTDGKRKKQGFDQALDANSKELNGPGIASAQASIGAYTGRKFLLATTPNAGMTLSNEKGGPLYKGFTFVWLPDPAKDPDAKARLSFEVR